MLDQTPTEAMAAILPLPTIEAFKGALRGSLIQPGDAEYDSARSVYNAMISRRPALIARCAGVADVISAVNYAREHQLTISIRGGGHNVVGFAVNDGGLVIDLSRMKGIRVDPMKKTVRAEGGVTWGDLDHATHAFGYAVPGGIVSTTGIAGLTLGGGVGNLSRTYGLSCDSLVSADVVTADGRFVTASATENEDLFWGLRGGGGNFGVVTSFEYRLHPAHTVLAGPIFFGIERAGAAMRFYRDLIATAPEQLNAFFGFHIAPPAPFVPEHLHGTHVCAIFINYVGPIEEGEKVVKPIREFGPPLLDLCAPVPYPALQSMFDELLPPGLQNYWKSHFVKELPDAAIEEHVKYGALVPTIQSGMHLYPISGAVHRVGPDETAFPYRDAGWVANIVAIYPDATETPQNVRWVREYWEALRPSSLPGAYINFLGDEGEGRIKDSYGRGYERLVALKEKYDPTNLFHMNQNIKPGGAKPTSSKSNNGKRANARPTGAQPNGPAR